jgi:hypothetical protein
MISSSLSPTVSGLIAILATVAAASAAEPERAATGIDLRHSRMIGMRLVTSPPAQLFELPANFRRRNLVSDAAASGQSLLDRDADGLTLAEESLVGTDRLLADSDGDGLLDGWEVHGVHGIDLRAMGASPLHKDIFIEMDYMRKLGNLDALRPTPATIARIEQAFERSPVRNPDGTTGIRIHLIEGEEVPFDEDLDIRAGEFRALKRANFDPLCAPVFHYMVWANGYGGGDSSGYSMTIPGSDFIVTLGHWPEPGGTEE